MKITINNKTTKIKFEDLKAGDCFKTISNDDILSNCFYMRLLPTQSEHNTVALADGIRCYVELSQTIVQYNAELIASEV